VEKSNKITKNLITVDPCISQIKCRNFFRLKLEYIIFLKVIFRSLCKNSFIQIESKSSSLRLNS